MHRFINYFKSYLIHVTPNKGKLPTDQPITDQNNPNNKNPHDPEQ